MIKPTKCTFEFLTYKKECGVKDYGKIVRPEVLGRLIFNQLR